MSVDERLENRACAEADRTGGKPPINSDGDCRPMAPTPQTPAQYIRQRAHQMRVEAKQLDELADSLPAKMSSPAETALFRVLIRNGI